MRSLRKAVLIIHGFAGGTYDEEYLSTYLELNGFDVYTFTLPGHERALFNHATRNDWKESCDNHIKMIIEAGYKKIYVIGHSMGGVLACYLAAKYKEIKKIVLAAPAFKYMTFDEDEFKLTHALRNSPKLLKYYSKEDIISRAIQFPRSVIKEFMTFVDESQDYPNKITCPVLIVHGTLDQIVPLKSSKKILEEFPNKDKELVVLEGVTHDIFRSDRKEEVSIKIKNFLAKWL